MPMATAYEMHDQIIPSYVNVSLLKVDENSVFPSVTVSCP